MALTINESEKTTILTSLYETIGKMDITSIIVAIDKQKFIKKHTCPDNIQVYGYNFIVERFDKLLRHHNSKGMIRIDKTTIPGKVSLNSTDSLILKTINFARKNGTSIQPPATTIIEEPIFNSSDERIGLQIADALAHCASKKLIRHANFNSCWNAISPKLRSVKGMTKGYGFKIYPD